MRTPTAVIACVALCALAAPASAMAADSERRQHCPSASAGPAFGGDSPAPATDVYRGLKTRNLSCRKGERIMDAFASRYGWPRIGKSFTSRINGFRCKARFTSIEENGRFLVKGTIACRKGARRAEWWAIGPGSDGGGGGE